tara:strand:+ start:642 stop:926 length:285 start_codon:yes stop_codon:yes gene_type:complete
MWKIIGKLALGFAIGAACQAGATIVHNMTEEEHEIEIFDDPRIKEMYERYRALGVEQIRNDRCVVNGVEYRHWRTGDPKPSAFCDSVFQHWTQV